MNDQIRRFELDMCEPDRTPESDQVRRRKLRLGPGGRRWLAIVAAVAVGAALGGVGVRKERDAATVREARSTLSLAAAIVGVEGLDETGDRDVAFHVQVFNTGGEPLDLSRGTVTGRGYPAPGRPNQDSRYEVQVTVDAGQSVQLNAFAGSPRCDAAGAGNPPLLRVTAVTIDGRLRTAELPLADPLGFLGQTRDSACSLAVDTVRVPISLTIERPFSFEGRHGEPVLHAALRADVFEGQVEIDGGGRTTVFDLAVGGGLPVLVTARAGRELPVELTVRRCVPAAEIGTGDELDIPIQVTYLHEKQRTTVWLEPAAVVQLVELVHRTCG